MRACFRAVAVAALGAFVGQSLQRPVRALDATVITLINASRCTADSYAGNHADRRGTGTLVKR